MICWPGIPVAASNGESQIPHSLLHRTVTYQYIRSYAKPGDGWCPSRTMSGKRGNEPRECSIAAANHGIKRPVCQASNLNSYMIHLSLPLYPPKAPSSVQVTGWSDEAFLTHFANPPKHYAGCHARPEEILYSNLDSTCHCMRSSGR
jgi:hypothetical protein